jgi:hypothetical protein
VHLGEGICIEDFVNDKNEKYFYDDTKNKESKPIYVFGFLDRLDFKHVVKVSMTLKIPNYEI